MKRPRPTDILLAVLLGCAFAGPAIGSWYIHSYQDPISQVNGQYTPVFSSVTQVELDGVKQAAVSLTWTTAQGLVAPNWAGTITAVPISAGDIVREGTVVAEIDGVQRVAAETTSPFYRLLTLDSQGRDVEDLNLLLRRLGYAHGPGGRWTSGTSAGVASLQRRIGLPPTVESVFDPAWLVWLPNGAFAVGSIDLTLGGLAPSPGTQFATPVATLSEALLTQQDASGLILDPDVKWSFKLSTGAAALEVVVDPQGVGRIADLPALSSMITVGAEAASGQVAYSQPIKATAVPVQAIITGAEGKTCLWLDSDFSKEPEPWPVTVIDGDVSATYISEIPPPTARVLVNPAEMTTGSGSC
jgi:hypothetical protein